MVLRNSVDIHVGNRLKVCRLSRGMSQHEIGCLVGITFQQIQKYESGSNRIGAGRLYQFAKALDTSVSSFFDGYNEHNYINDNLKTSLNEITKSIYGNENNDKFPDDKEVFMFIKRFAMIKDPISRRAVLDLMKALGANRGPKNNDHNDNGEYDTKLD